MRFLLVYPNHLEQYAGIVTKEDIMNVVVPIYVIAAQIITELQPNNGCRSHYITTLWKIFITHHLPLPQITHQVIRTVPQVLLHTRLFSSTAAIRLIDIK